MLKYLCSGVGRLRGRLVVPRIDAQAAHDRTLHRGDCLKPLLKRGSGVVLFGDYVLLGGGNGGCEVRLGHDRHVCD